MRKLWMVLLPLSVMAALACSSKKPAEKPRVPQNGAVEGVEAGEEEELPLLPTYTEHVKPLLDAKCIKCHTAAKATAKVPDLSTFDKVKTASTKVIASVKSGKMPKGGTKLPAKDLELLELWKSKGLKEKPAPLERPGGEEGDKVSYKGWVKGYLQATCISCHGASSQNGDLTSYEAAKTLAAGMVTRMKNGTMPQGGTKATATQIAKMEKWVTDDTPEEDSDVPGGEEAGATEEGEPADEVTYDGQIKQLLSTSCVRCHGVGKPTDLSTKAKAQAKAEGIVSQVEADTMPQNATPLGADKKKLLKDWLESGAK